MDSALVLSDRAARIRLRWRVTPLRLCAALTCLALFVRLTNLASRPLWLDEAFSAWFSERSFHYLWHVLPTYEAHPPLYYSLLKLWRMFFGGSPFTLRFFSTLLGIGAVPVVIAVVLEQERLSPTRQPLLRAGLAGFLVACSPLLIVVGQEARPYPLLTLGYAVAILGLIRLMRQFEEGAPGGWPSWLMLGAGTELTLWAHSLGLLYAACLALGLVPALLRPPLTRVRLARGIAIATLVAAAYLPCLLMVVNRAHDWRANWLQWEPSMLLQLVVLYTVPVEVLTVASAVAAVAMVLLIKRALAATYASKHWNSDRAMLLLWLGPPLGAAFISATFIPIFLERTLSASLIPAYLMIAGAIGRSDEAHGGRIIAGVICITLLPAAFQTAARPAAERWDLVASALSRNASARDEVWLYPADSALPLKAVGRIIRGKVRPIPEPFPTLDFKGPIRAGWPAVVSLTPAQAARFAGDPAIKDVPVIWLVTRQSGIFDPHGDMPTALARVRRAGALEHWGYINVQPYYRR